MKNMTVSNNKALEAKEVYPAQSGVAAMRLYAVVPLESGTLRG